MGRWPGLSAARIRVTEGTVQEEAAQAAEKTRPLLRVSMERGRGGVPGAGGQPISAQGIEHDQDEVRPLPGPARRPRGVTGAVATMVEHRRE